MKPGDMVRLVGSNFVYEGPIWSSYDPRDDPKMIGKFGGCEVGTVVEIPPISSYIKVLCHAGVGYVHLQMLELVDEAG